ncbi:MAG: glycoside hydrolase family 13 protein [Flavobacteriaceae bacterium]
MRIFLCFVLLLTMNEVSSQISKIEPPFWWSGMQRPTLEILFYGDDIASYQPVSEDIKISDVARTRNPNYLFVTVETTKQEAGSVIFTFGKESAAPIAVTYEFRERREGSKTRKGFDASDLIYLIMPDRFANGDPSRDSHPEMHENANRTEPGGRHGGDLRGIIDNLDYIEDLGATAIWSTPMCEDNDPQGSYHGYAQSDVYRIDPRIGTNGEYAELADNLHQRGMKLIMDYVTNHWGLEHWMIKDLPDENWVYHINEYRQTNHRMTTQMDPYASELDLKYCIEGWFVPSMPDLNQTHPKMLTYLIQNAIWWIEFANLDGLRVDTYSYNNKETIAQWTKAIMDEYPSFNIVGEIWMHNQAQIAFWQKNSKIGELQNYNSQLPSVMDFTLHDAIIEVFDEEDPQWNTGMVRIYENFVNDFLYPDTQNIMVFAENHDTPRINEIYKNIADYKIIMSLIATTRGIPQIYYGSEIGMRGQKSQGDGDIRRDFPGGWPGDEVNAFERSGRDEIQNQYYDFSAKLFNWRKTARVVHSGEMKHYTPEENVYVYFRTLPGQTVMVILNPNNASRELNPDRFNENIGQYTQGIDVITGDVIGLNENMLIERKTAYILELK